MGEPGTDDMTRKQIICQTLRAASCQQLPGSKRLRNPFTFMRSKLLVSSSNRSYCIHTMQHDARKQCQNNVENNDIVNVLQWPSFASNRWSTQVLFVAFPNEHTNAWTNARTIAIAKSKQRLNRHHSGTIWQPIGTQLQFIEGIVCICSAMVIGKEPS